MNPPNHLPNGDPEERFEAWLSSQPLTPAPDFVARTLARIRAEAALVVSAKAGDEAAIDALLDRWLGEQTIEPDFEPAQLATSTRRAATREEQEEGRPEDSNWRRVIPFPAWARTVTALAAAACVALLGYVSLNHPVNHTTPSASKNAVASLPVGQAEAVGNTFQSAPAPYAWNSDPNYISDLSSSFKDLAPVANANDPDVITNEFGSDGAIN
jgi:hypothetical protein